MNTEKIPNRCPKCGSPLPADAPQGLCARCLLAAAATPTEAGQPHGERWTPPPLRTIAVAFPQLEILQLIGTGGMGAVYKARQPKLDRFVALKILPQALANDAGFAERFSREARLLARLNHAGIVSVYDYGETGGFFYLLMEFVDGVNLRQAMRAGRFSPQQALFIVPKICEALQFAHDEGILHRDFKPENILLDTRGRVKIADFGIAKLIGGKIKGATLTASGMVVGTPHYMAPEQLEHPQDVDQRADIYSLGVVFYEMLTGELPIGRFAPPSKKTPVDPRVDAIVLQALEKERERRQHNAAEVKTEVEQITSSMPAAPMVGPATTAPAGRVPCYFSTPKRMQNCFRGAQAHIFQCKGELRLEADKLTFVSPWQTQVVIPLKEIRDLSIGQFQMWTTPWPMKYGRIFFLSITFGPGDRECTVHLTPVPASVSGAASINALVAEWIEAIRQAVVSITGASPHVSAPDAVTIRAQHLWFRRTGPLLLFAPLTAWVVGVMNIRSPFGPAPLAPWLGAFLLMLLVLLRLALFAYGFFKANQALKSGCLDLVTSDEPPGDTAEDVDRDISSVGTSKSKKPKLPFWWKAGGWAFVFLGLWAVIDTLTGLYSRPINQTYYPGIAQLFAGIALLTLNRRWRVVALVALTLTLMTGAFICVMLVISPEHGSVALPMAGLNAPVTEYPRLAATAVVFLVFALGLPCYLLLSRKGKSFFGIARSK